VNRKHIPFAFQMQMETSSISLRENELLCWKWVFWQAMHWACIDNLSY